MYTSEVVIPAKAHGIEITHDYRPKKGAIPLPATLSMLLGNRIGLKDSGQKSRLYSPYPFPWREASGGLTDSFSKAAWMALQANPQMPYASFEKVDDVRGILEVIMPIEGNFVLANKMLKQTLLYHKRNSANCSRRYDPRRL